MRMYLLEIDRGLKRLDILRGQAKDLSLKTIKDVGKPSVDPGPQLNVLMEQFLITPVDMDPTGIVGKFDHLLDVRDQKFKDDVRKIAPSADDAQVNNLENLVEASWALNTIYRIVRHFYLLGRKTSSFFIIIQLQSLLPLIMQEAEAYLGAAIGGIGTERFKIEETATNNRIPVYAVIVKESIQEAITPMKKEILEAGEKVIERIKRLVIERTKPGDTIIVAGIGNTIGIGQ